MAQELAAAILLECLVAAAAAVAGTHTQHTAHLKGQQFSHQVAATCRGMQQLWT